MPELLKAPVTPAQQARDALLGALVGLARATTNEPKTDDTDEVLNAGLRLAAQPDAPEEKLHRMLETVRTEKHRVGVVRFGLAGGGPGKPHEGTEKGISCLLGRGDRRF